MRTFVRHLCRSTVRTETSCLWATQGCAIRFGARDAWASIQRDENRACLSRAARITKGESDIAAAGAAVGLHHDALSAVAAGDG